MSISDSRVFKFEDLAAYDDPKKYREQAARCQRTLKGFADRVILYLDDGIRFESDSGMAFLWNGQYWINAGHKNVMITTVCHEVRNQIQSEAAEAELQTEAETNKLKESYNKWLGRIDNSGSYFDDVIKKLKSDPSVSINGIKSHPYLVNCPNGIVDLRTGKTMPHDKSYMMTGITGIPMVYNPKLKRMSPAKVWETFVEYAPMTAGFIYQTFHVKGNTDSENLERMQYVIAMLAHLINGSAETQKFYFIKGKGGNGKGTLDRMMLSIMGPYGRTADPEMFTSAGSKEYKRQTADFIGIRFIAIPEISKKSRLNAALVKNWAGGDEISYMRLYESEGKFVPESTLVFSLNHILHVDEYGPAMRRRFVLLKTENSAKSLPGGEIKGYEKVMIEKEGSVFGSVLLRMSMSLLNGEITEPSCILRDSTEYVTNDDFVAEFVAACCEATAEEYREGDLRKYMTLDELYSYAKKYNSRRGSGHNGRFMNMQAFKQAIEDVSAIPDVHYGYYSGDDFNIDPNRGITDFIFDFDLSDEGKRILYHQSADEKLTRQYNIQFDAQTTWQNEQANRGND